MDRPRHRRRDPQRTGPIRHAGGAWQEGEPRRDAAGREHDAASAGVREGYRVIEEQIRRGRRMAQELGDEPRPYEPRSGDRYGRRDHRRRYSYDEEPYPRSAGGPLDLLGMPLRHLERLTREILRQLISVRPDPLRLAELLFQIQIEAIAGIARLGLDTLGLGGRPWEDPLEEEAGRITVDVDEPVEIFDDEEDEEPAGEPWSWPPAPSAPAVIRATVPIPVYVWSHERTEIDLDLPPGAQSLPLEVEPTLMVTSVIQPAHSAFEADFFTPDDGPAILRVRVPRDLPAGLYPRRLLVRGTGEPVGTLTVQVGTMPTIPAKTPAKTPAKARPAARKR